MAVPVITTEGVIGDKKTGNKGQAFSYNIVASGSPTSYTITALPTGVSLNTSTGLISGTPTVTGVGSGSMTAINGDGTSGFKSLLWYLSPPNTPAITSGLFQNVTASTPVTYTITASNTPTSFSATNLPFGLSLNPTTGVIAGTLSATTGITLSSIRAINAVGNGALTELTWTVTAGGGGSTPVITSSLEVDAIAGEVTTYQITATNTPTNFLIKQAPTGWTCDPITGLVTSPVLSVGIITFKIVARNDTGSDEETIVFTAALPEGPGETPPPDFIFGDTFSYQESNAFAEVTKVPCPNAPAGGLPPGPPTGLTVTVSDTDLTTATMSWSPP